MAIERRDGKTEKVEGAELPRVGFARGDVASDPFTLDWRILRWFASPDVVPLERYRDREQTERILKALRQRKREREARSDQRDD